MKLIVTACFVARGFAVYHASLAGLGEGERERKKNESESKREYWKTDLVPFEFSRHVFQGNSHFIFFQVSKLDILTGYFYRNVRISSRKICVDWIVLYLGCIVFDWIFGVLEFLTMR